MSSFRHRLAGLFTLGVSIALCTAVASSDAARADESRSGDFDLYRNGVRIGSESWNWDVEASGAVVLTGRCAVEIDGVSTTIHPSLRVDGTSLTPIAYEYERVQGGETRRVSTTFDGGKAAQRIEENGMTSKRQLKIKSSDLVIYDDFVSQFLLVAERYDFEKGGTQDFTVFDAKSGRNYVAHAMVRGLGTVENGIGKFRVRRLTLNLEDLAVDIYVDSQGNVPQICIPMRGIEAKMPGYKGEQKVSTQDPVTQPALGQRVQGG